MVGGLTWEQSIIGLLNEMLISHFFRTSIFNRDKKKYCVASTNRSMEKLKVSKLKAGASLSSVVSVLEARQQGSHRQGAARHLS